MIIQHLKLFSNILKLNEFLNAVPCRWNTTLLKLDCVECPRRTFHRRYYLLIHLVALLVYCLQAVYTFGTKAEYLKLSRAELFLYQIGLLTNIAAHITLRACNKKADLICSYVNGVMNFQKAHNHLYNRNIQTPSLNEKFSLLCVYGLAAAGCSISVAYPTIVHWFNFCRPSLFGYWLLPECNQHLIQTAWVGIPVKLAVICFNIWMCAFGLINTALLLGAIMFVFCVFTMQKCIEL